MKSIVQLIFIIILFSIWSCSKSQSLNSRWRGDAYNQGMENIPAFYYFYNSDCSLFYLISNDDKNLYINAKFTDRSQQMMVLHSGLTIWIDTTGKTKKRLGIRYPLVNPEKFAGRNENNFQNYPDMDPGFNQHPPLEAMIKEIELLGFEYKKSRRIIPAEDSLYIHGNVYFNDNNELLYEVCIPFQAINFNGFKIGIGFRMDDNKLNERRSSNNHPPGGGGFPQGGPPPGGRNFSQGGQPMGRPGQPGNFPEQNRSEINFWVKKIRLAEK